MSAWINLIDIVGYLESQGYDFEVEGEIDKVRNFASIKCVEPNCMYFFTGKNLPSNISLSIVFVLKSYANPSPNNTLIKVEHPQLLFYKLMNAYYPKVLKGISKTAVISEKSILPNNLEVGNFVTIGSAKIGENSIIGSNVVIHDNVTIGENVVISDNTVIGAPGVAWVWDPATGERIRQPQIGHVYIADNVFIGSNVTIARGSVNETTKLLSGTVLSHGTQVGHGVQIHENVHVANNCALAGNATLGFECFLGAGAVVSSQVSIAAKVIVGAGAIVSKNIDVEGVTYIGMPARAIPKQNSLNGVPNRK
ncbi:DapH/DapD/GlmU-related protein [Pseudoalteromonas sp. SSMSWG5]|uniref:DapH/DapD/GlmU-related protein n=1 Tax=Pseudoalteromonas sp. SSMSWG5 TaxID=3139396 RepID=UPI003BAD3811